jgi:hypothetical protein
MNETNVAPQNTDPGHADPAEMKAALFAHLVIQQANMAMMLMGKTPHPETGQTMRDLEAARLFIDMLEMLETRTRGNLSPQEQNMLKQTLMSVRMAFVEAANSGSEPQQAPAQPAAKPAEPILEKPSTAAPAEESHKKFSKKY